MAKHSALTKEKTVALQKLVAKLLREKYAGNQTRMARDTGMLQSHLSQILRGLAGGGMVVAYRISRIAPKEVAAILGLQAEEIVQRGPTADRAVAALVREGYPEDMAEASVTWVLQVVRPEDEDYRFIFGAARAIAAAGQIYSEMAAGRKSSAPAPLQLPSAPRKPRG